MSVLDSSVDITLYNVGVQDWGSVQNFIELEGFNECENLNIQWARFGKCANGIEWTELGKCANFIE